MSTILAYDLGASSGRAVLGRLEGRRIAAEEIHRFSNDPVSAGGRLYWDILRLYHELKQGLLKAKHLGVRLHSLGIDSWAVDFGLLGADGELLGNPYHYRDRRTEGVMEQLFAVVPRSELFHRTGIQFLPFNTIYQLAAMKRANSPLFAVAERFLMIPDLLRYFLTGEAVNEFTNATTTQLFNPSLGDWDRELLRRVGIPDRWFGRIVQPGTEVGVLRAAVCDELGVERVPVIAVAEHDTGSAVAAVPASEESFAYLSCGTWSLMGTEVRQPVIGREALALNFTNEGGAFGTYRLLKNIMGLWILQEVAREWERAGFALTHAEIVQLASEARPFVSWIDPDDPLFLPPGDMTPRIRDYCVRTGQPVPATRGEFARCVLESLAFTYRRVLESLERLTDAHYGGLHMVGGGIRNEWLCQWTADAIGRPVWAGPVEASAIGNLIVQWIAQGRFADIREARAAVRVSFPVKEYRPQRPDVWSEAYERYRRVTGKDNDRDND